MDQAQEELKYLDVVRTSKLIRTMTNKTRSRDSTNNKWIFGVPKLGTTKLASGHFESDRVSLSLFLLSVLLKRCLFALFYSTLASLSGMFRIPVDRIFSCTHAHFVITRRPSTILVIKIESIFNVHDVSLSLSILI